MKGYFDLEQVLDQNGVNFEKGVDVNEFLLVKL